MPYHVRIHVRRVGVETKVDATGEQLKDQFLDPYYEGRAITVNGRVIRPEDITWIKVSESEWTTAEAVERLKATGEVRYANISSPNVRERVAAVARDVTDEFIKGPPGIAATHSEATPTASNSLPSVPDPRRVFVVHGRNIKAREAMFSFLRSVDLSPIEWSQAVTATGRASPYIGEILDAAFAMAQAVVVLLTPDDEARLRPEFHQPEDSQYEHELTPQARQNVLFEAGFAFGRHSDRVILVQLGQIRPFSDIAGRHHVLFDGSSVKRQDLAQRLEVAGCVVSLTGVDWHSAGNFSGSHLGFKESVSGPPVGTPPGPRFDGSTCVDVPTPVLARAWQVSAPRGYPGPVHAGQVIEVGLRNKFGTEDETYYLSARVVRPDETSTTATQLMQGPDWAGLLYPVDFAGAVPLTPGNYTVVWETSGGFIACDGFTVVP